MIITFTPKEKGKLKQLGVKALILFGSQAQQVATKDSDFDIGAIGKSGKNVYDELYDLLSTKINRLVDIDIVFLYEAPMELQSHVAEYGRVLYEDPPTTFANFREKVMIDYADFAPLRKIFQQATLARI